MSDLVKDFGDEYIDYLKVDVESSEIKVNEINIESLRLNSSKAGDSLKVSSCFQAIPQWLKSGILEKVGQIGIEFHLGKAARFIRFFGVN